MSEEKLIRAIKKAKDALNKPNGGEYHNVEDLVAIDILQEENAELKTALGFKEVNDSIDAPEVDYRSFILGYKEATAFWLSELEKRENEILRLKKESKND